MKKLVEEKFGFEAVNKLNELFYSSLDGDIYDTGLAKIYIDSSAVFRAFGDFIFERAKYFYLPNMRVKQLCAGTQAVNLWKSVAKQNLAGQKIEVEVTDFGQPDLAPGVVMDLQELGVEVGAGEYSLFEEMATLEGEDRFDLMMVTYGFDSVWRESDGFYEKADGKWFKVAYRLVVEGEDGEVVELMRDALRGGRSHLKLMGEWFNGVRIEEERVEVDILKEEFGWELDIYYRSFESVRCSLPGTMLERVKEAFEKQLKIDGAFLIGDVVVPNRESASDWRRSAVCRSGVGARYKVDDYGFAKWCLEGWGFEVSLQTLDDFVGGNKVYDQEFDVKLGERGREWNYVMVVERGEV